MNDTPTKHTSLVEALAAAQGQFPAVLKDRTATVKSEKGSYSYSYANLADVLAAVRPGLSANNIALCQRLVPNGAGLMLHTELRGYGEVLESSMPVTTGPTAPQALGSALSYYRRYALMALVGVAAEEDDDDGQEAGKSAPKRPQARPQEPASRTVEEPREQPRVPPDEAWLANARKIVADERPDAVRMWWNSDEQKRRRQDIHKRRADLEPAMDELKARVAERWWECSSLHQPVNGSGWQKWQGAFARSVDAAPTVEKLAKLVDDNAGNLDALEAENKRAHALLMDKIDNQRLLLKDNETAIDLGESGNDYQPTLAEIAEYHRAQAEVQVGWLPLDHKLDDMLTAAIRGQEIEWHEAAARLLDALAAEEPRERENRSLSRCP